MEIERKYLLKQIPELEKYECHKIEQAYLCTGPVVRVRREDETYYMTYKSGGLMAREEYNLALTKEFEPPFAPLIMAEVEFETEEAANAFEAPEWFGEDVTFDGRYHNSYMSRMKFED